MKTVQDTFDVTVGTTKFTRPFQKVVLDTPEDVMQLLTQNPADVIKHINSSIDLAARAEARQKFVNSEENAALLTVEKSVKEFMALRKAAGNPVTEEQARKFVEMVKTANLGV